MLNDFSNTKLDAQKPADTPSQPKPETSKPAPSSEPHANPEDALGDEDFAKQLQAGMAELLGDLEKSVRDDAEIFMTRVDSSHSPICRSNSRTCSNR